MTGLSKQDASVSVPPKPSRQPGMASGLTQRQREGRLLAAQDMQDQDMLLKINRAGCEKKLI